MGKPFIFPNFNPGWRRLGIYDQHECKEWRIQGVRFRLGLRSVRQKIKTRIELQS